MTFSEIFPSWQKLSTKIVGALFGFLLLALMAIGTTLWLSWQLEGSAAAINEAGSLRMHSYRLTIMLSRLANGQANEQQSAAQELKDINATFALLQRGDPQRPIFLPPTAGIHDEFEKVAERWQLTMLPLAHTILALDRTTGQTAWMRFHPQVDSFVSDINTLVSLIEKDSEKRTFWLRSSQLILVALAIVGTVIIVYLMFLMIIEPVTRLQEGILRMTEKDFSVRLPVESQDEFGLLTSGFNQMADRLENLYTSLESRVQEKTAKLEGQNRELALLYDSAAFLQRPQPVEALCEGFMQRISDYFQADGSSVRVLEVARGNLHMVVHHGLSNELVAAEHCLKVGDCLCGAAVAEKITVVHDMRRIDKAHKLQCHKDGFQTVSVFHIHAHQQHIGFFNLHFRSEKKFSKGEMALLDTLGQLLGVAIQNIRLATREREMAISEERNLVAQGLHDSIAQGLTFLNIQVQMLEDSLNKNEIEEVSSIVPALRAGVQESYDDVRELLLNFRSKLAEGDLIRSLETTFEKFRQQTGIEVDFSAEGDGAPFPREQQLQLLFIAQEALSNIRKHAAASKVTIRLQNGQDFSMSIQDNGVGFDAATLLQKGESHVGINIMRERAQRIDALFDVLSVPGEGTNVQLRLPREQRRAA